MYIKSLRTCLDLYVYQYLVDGRRNVMRRVGFTLDRGFDLRKSRQRIMLFRHMSFGFRVDDIKKNASPTLSQSLPPVYEQLFESCFLVIP